MAKADFTTWTTLLAGWTDFARSAVSLPDDGEGGRWKQAVPGIIALHASAMALGELTRIDPEERPLVMDRAEMTIRDQASALHAIWSGEHMPESVSELIDDARLAWERALHEGLEWVAESDRFVAKHPAMLAEQLLDAGFVGEVCVLNPAAIGFRSGIVATARERDGGPVDEEISAIIERFLEACDGAVGEPVVGLPVRQVYREMDFMRGGPVRDVLTPVVGALPAGQPLLIPVVSGGGVASIPPPGRRPPEMDPIPVVDAEPEAV